MTFAAVAAVVVARCCYTLSQMISVEENRPNRPPRGRTVRGDCSVRRRSRRRRVYVIRCRGLGVRLCGKGRSVVPVVRGGGDGSECPSGEREISKGEGVGRGRVIDQTSGPFYAALCVTPPPPEFLDKTRLMVVTRRHWYIVVVGGYLGVWVCECVCVCVNHIRKSLFLYIYICNMVKRSG